MYIDITDGDCGCSLFSARRFLSKVILVIINDVHCSFCITMMTVDLFLKLRCYVFVCVLAVLLIVTDQRRFLTNINFYTAKITQGYAISNILYIF